MKVSFVVPSSISSFDRDIIAVPFCKSAYYLCMLVGRDGLSLRELFIVGKIGFDVQYLYEASGKIFKPSQEEGILNTFLRSTHVMSFLDKLAKIQALIDRSSSDGERQAAELAKERLLAKLIENQIDQAIEYKISLDSPWKKRLFVALCSKHGFITYRYHRQKYTTARLRVSKSIMDEILWPEFIRYSNILEEFVEEILQDLINKIYQAQEEIEIAGELGLQVD